MAGIEFEVIITQEGINYARGAQNNISRGWHLTPKRYAISSIASGVFNDTRTLSSMNETWITRNFSTITPIDTNKILNDITIPANARNSSIAIREIYFIYENYSDNASTEFLFAIARPTQELIFIPGVSQSFKFLFGLNNIDVEGIIDIQYTYPEEIFDHNIDYNVHPFLLKTDGSRVATGILSYDSNKTFDSNLQLVSKGYVDNKVSADITVHENNTNAHPNLLDTAGTKDVTGVLHYSIDPTFNNDSQIINKKYVDTSVSDLHTTVTSEISAVSTTLDNRITSVANSKASTDLDNLSATGKARIAVKNYISTETYSKDDVVMAIVDGEVKLYKSLVNSNRGNALTNESKWEEVQLGGTTRNIGEIVASTIPLTDAGLHLLDGTLINGNGVYKDFVDYIASIYNSNLNYFTTESNWQSSVNSYGVCGKFVYNSTNRTVRLPKIVGLTEGTNTISELGNLTEAGLPNITGKVDGSRNPSTNQAFGETSRVNTDVEGAFEGIWGGQDACADAGGHEMLRGFTFDASRSSSLYKNDFNKVQPQSIKVLYYIVVANSTKKTNIQIDIDRVVTDLNNKADRDLSNTTDAGKILMSGMGMPSNRYINLTLGASDTRYTAPANGWIMVTQGFSDACNLWVATVYSSKDGICMSATLPQSGVLNVYIPIRKDETFKVGYTGTLMSHESNRFEFIYAVGSESEAN